ncbi:MAG: Crp/Fnr family transcriptional regulator [Novosphingobium sp.]
MSIFLQSLRNPLHASLLAGLDEAQLAPFLDRAIPKSFAARQIIQQRGEDAAGCWIIRSGRVRVGQFSAGGKFIVLSLLGLGESWGELALLRRAPRALDAVADEATELLWIDAARFDAVLDSHPETMRRLLALLGDQLQFSLQTLVAMRGEGAESRMASLLAALGGDGIPLRLTQQDLAELAGVSRMTVNLQLKAWEAAGLIRRSYGTITVRDPAGLRKVAARG